MNRRDFRKLALVRVSDASALLKTRRNPSGAYYIAGYAIECALKACICRRIKVGDWPPKPEDVRKLYSHDLEDLLRLAQLKILLDTAIRSNPTLAGHWGTVKDWSKQSRYQTYTQTQAQVLMTAITDPTNGVLAWIQQYW